MPKNHRLRRPRFSVQVLLISVTFAALAVVAWNSYYGWYEQNHGRHLINRVLRNKIRNGDSLEGVSARLIFEGKPSHFLTTHPNSDWFRDHYAYGQDGLRDSDEFMEFSLGNARVILQFRDNRLINHDPTEFSNSESEFDLDKLKTTPIARKLEEVRREMGIAQAIAGCIAFVALSFALGLAKQRSYSPKSLRLMLTIPAALCTAIICFASNLRPALLGVVVVGLVATIAWNISGRITKQWQPTAAKEG